METLETDESQKHLVTGVVTNFGKVSMPFMDDTVQQCMIQMTDNFQIHLL